MCVPLSIAALRASNAFFPGKHPCQQATNCRLWICWRVGGEHLPCCSIWTTAKLSIFLCCSLPGSCFTVSSTQRIWLTCQISQCLSGASLKGRQSFSQPSHSIRHPPHHKICKIHALNLSEYLALILPDDMRLSISADISIF